MCAEAAKTGRKCGEFARYVIKFEHFSIDFLDQRCYLRM